MIVLDEAVAPPVEALPRPVATDAPRRCTLCLSWRPADEMVQLNSLLTWCSACALQYPELVPPPIDVFWPLGGFLAGALTGCMLASTHSTTQVAVAVDRLIGALVGIGALLATQFFLVDSSLRLLRKGSAVPKPTIRSEHPCGLLVGKGFRGSIGSLSAIAW